MTTRGQTRIIKWVLTAVVVITVVGMGGVFYRLRTDGNAPLKPLSLISGNADVSLDNIEHTATSDGRTQWRLTAEKARLTEGRRQLLLTRPSVVFFLEDGGQVTLTADRGVLETQSNDIAVDGHVVVSNRDYRLVTEALHYSHGDRVLTGDQPVSIDGTWAALKAQRMRVELDAGIATFNGDVKGWLARDFS